MAAALCVLAVLLALATAVNLSLTFAIIRRLREIESRPAAGAPDRLPNIGSAIADFRAEATNGDLLTLSDLEGETLVGFVMVGCGPCGKLIETLESSAAISSESPLFFITGDPASEEAHTLATRLGRIGRVALLGRSSTVTAAFGGVAVYPTLLQIDGGVIARAGSSLDAVSRPLTKVRSAA